MHRYAIRSAALAIAFVARTPCVDAQASALSGLLSNATDINFYWTQAGSPRPDARPSGTHGASGLGFEFAFGIPGGVTRQRAQNSNVRPLEGNGCEARYQRGELKPGIACADTTFKVTKRQRGRDGITYEEELDVQKFVSTESVMTLELAVGFTQAGAFVSRRPENDFRVSLREAPSVAVYATYLPELPLLRDLPGDASPYLGVRSGLASLNAGRAYTPTSTLKFGGETFQLGPVAGLVTEIDGLNFFVEGSYMWRDFKSVEWDGSAALPATLPRQLNLSGATLAIGVQFEVKPHTGK